MRRASEIRNAGTWNAATAIDRVVLDADERHRRRIILAGERGTVFLLDLPHARALRDGDGLVLGDRLRIRRDHVLEDMLRGLGARLTPLEAPFDPEPGAYYADHQHGCGDV